MAEGDRIDVRPDSMDGLAQALYLGMLALNGLAGTTPPLPNAGESTAAIGRAFATVSEGMAGLTEAFGTAGEQVELTVGTLVATEQTNTDQLDIGLE